MTDPEDKYILLSDLKEYRKLKDKTQFTKYHHLSELFDDKNTFTGNIEDLVFVS